MPKSLEERVLAFDLMQLPGQPQGMHMGTSYLVHDLTFVGQWSAVTIRHALRELVAQGRATFTGPDCRRLYTKPASDGGER